MKLPSIFTTLVLVLFLTSCVGDKKKAKEVSKTMKISSKEVLKGDKNSVLLTLTANDVMKFSKTEFKVKESQKVTLSLHHIGKRSIKVMGHNFVLLKQGVAIPSFASAAAIAGQKEDWIPRGGKDVIAHTKMIGGKQSTQVTFTAPAAGIYDFICSFPGHSGLMKGKFLVE